MRIIGINGKAKSGKDTLADIFVRRYGFVKIAFADPIKRICAEVFGFSREQLWGDLKEAPDLRFPHKFSAPDEPAEYLTPRYAFQTLGTEWGRHCSPDTWVRSLLVTADHIARGAFYTPMSGVQYVSELKPRYAGIVVPDARYANELREIRNVGGTTVRISRETAGLEGAAGQHSSEVEQDSLPLSLFEFVIPNEGTLEELAVHAGDIIASTRGAQ